MNTPDHRILPKYRPSMVTASINRFNPATMPKPPVVADPRRLPGDTRALRGIPAIGRGVQGAIDGTRPG